LSKPEDASVRFFEGEYRARGIAAQRLYPNEALLQFLGGNFFDLSPEARAQTRILEVGCGSGANLWMIAKEGFAAHGIDASAAGIEAAREHLRGKWATQAQLAVATFDDLPYKPESFDAICDVVSLQHVTLKEAHAALRDVYRVLKPGGFFFSFRLSDVSVMFRSGGGHFIDSATLDNIDDSRMPLANNGPVSFWSPQLALEMYEAVGLEVERIERHGRTYQDRAQYVEYLAITARRPEAK
jgi:SAM-dependent methyltransferase